MTAPAVNGRPRRIGRGLAALLALLVVEAGVPALLVGLGLVPHALPSWNSVTGSLTRQDDGRLLLGVLAAGAWFCWAAFTVSLAGELIGLARRRPARRLPGLAWCQHAAAVLVAAVLAGLVAGPPAATVADPPPLPRLPAAVAAVAPAVDAAAVRADSVPVTLADDPAPAATSPYTVRPRDTLWAIAARSLGAGIRYPEIVALNPALVGPDNTIRAGDVLQLPVAPPATVDVTVAAGDTLSGLVTAVSHGSVGWQTAWALNVGRTEPDGARFTDPDLIRSGWTLTLPAASTPGPAIPAPQPSGPPGLGTPPGPATPPGSGSPPSTSDSTGSTSGPADPAAPATARGDAAESGAAGSGAEIAPLVAAATGGTLLAGGLLLALTRARRRRQRWRVPGGPVPTTAAELRPAERALRTAGEPRLSDVAFLDAALRGLTVATAATVGGTLPDVAAAGLDGQRLTLLIDPPRPDAPAPWRAVDDGARWIFDRSDATALRLPPTGTVLAPYPLLASIGTDADGTSWLLDLEHAGRLAVTGDADRARDLLRYFAAELAHNTWSQPVALTLVGLGEDLAPLGRDVLACTDDLVEPLTALGMTGKSVLSVAEAERVDVLDGRLRGVAGDAWAPRVVLVDPAAVGEPDNLADYLAALPAPGQRSATALAWTAPAATADTLPPATWRLELDPVGALRVPRLGLELVPHQMPSGEAAELAGLLAAAARLPDGSGPDDDRAAGGRAAGSRDGTGRSSGAAPERGRPTASTEASAPAAEDAALDRDLADWRTPGCPRPRVALLGPVEVRGAGRLPERKPREQWNTEIVAYLALHPRGVTPERLAADLWLDDQEPGRKMMQARQAVAIVRAWLGADPATGAEYLPRGNVGGADGGYRVEGSLVDADLFARLRRRARVRGPAGIADLEAALALVRGEPLDPRQRRPGGYGWLVDTPVDVEYAAMIVDVAHEVATRRLAAGEPLQAAEAAAAALRAHTGSDEPLLDLVAACDALGDRAEGDAYVRRILANHDAEVEEDLPPRTAAILFRRQRPD